MARLSDELIHLCGLCTDTRLALRLKAAAKRATEMETDNRRMEFRLQRIQDVVTDDELAARQSPIMCETPRGEVVHIDFPRGRAS